MTFQEKVLLKFETFDYNENSMRCMCLKFLQIINICFIFFNHLIEIVLCMNCTFFFKIIKEKQLTHLALNYFISL